MASFGMVYQCCQYLFKINLQHFYLFPHQELNVS